MSSEEMLFSEKQNIRKHYRFGPLGICMEFEQIPDGFHLPPFTERFEVEEDQCANSSEPDRFKISHPAIDFVTYHIDFVPNLIQTAEQLLEQKTGSIIQRKDLIIFPTESGECRLIHIPGEEPLYAISLQTAENRYEIRFDPDFLSLISVAPAFFAPFCLEKEALNKNAMILHSAYMCRNGRAILFSAPSGTGKSTQAGLWEQYRGTYQVNGDRSLLTREDGIWYANGWPICGSSGICRNEKHPIQALVMLSQAKENRITRLKGIGALREVLSQITVNNWNRNAQNQVFDQLELLLSEVPIYHLACDISENAVECLEKQLDTDCISNNVER